MTDEERIILKAILLEILETRRLLDNLTETVVKMSDKELLKGFKASKDDFTENQVDQYRGKLEEEVDTAKRELRSSKI